MKPKAAELPPKSGYIQVKIAYNSRQNWERPEIAEWQTVYYNAIRNSLNETSSVEGREWDGPHSVVVDWRPNSSFEGYSGHEP